MSSADFQRWVRKGVKSIAVRPLAQVNDARPAPRTPIQPIAVAVSVIRQQSPVATRSTQHRLLISIHPRSLSPKSYEEASMLSRRALLAGGVSCLAAPAILARAQNSTDSAATA